MGKKNDIGKMRIFWIKDQKSLPPRPENPESYPEHDIRHWYDQEYAAFYTHKKNIPPQRFDDTPRGKKVICIYPGNHPYMDDLREGAKKVADMYGIETQFYTTSWDKRLQTKKVEDAIAERPDLIIMVPENTNSCEDHYKRINEENIPIICSNSLPEPAVYQHILAWTGPDDWGQYRLLAREFAELMNYSGNYVIVRHMPGSSSYNARTWGFVSELNLIAPEIKLLEAETSYLDPLFTEKLVGTWLDKFGDSIHGIVSSGGSPLQMAINNVLIDYNREDMIRVSVGSCAKIFDIIQQGGVHAVAYQTGDMDGALAMQTAVDWFSGFKIEPVRFLPRFIVTRKNVQDFIEKKDAVPVLNDELLQKSIEKMDIKGVDIFFQDLFASLSNVKFIKEEFVRGYIIQLFSVLIQNLKKSGVELHEFFDDYEGIYKHLFDHQSIEQSFLWIQSTAKEIIRLMQKKFSQLNTVLKVIDYVDNHYTSPISLKTIADTFDVSPAYLGQQFKKEKGVSFSNYVNSIRIEKASDLLKNTNLSAKEIALSVGFSDHNYFYRIYKKYTGISPTEFRENLYLQRAEKSPE